MQAVERKKTVTISPEVHRKIVRLRRGNQTFGDVIEESIQALEEKNSMPELPHFEDIDLEKHDKEVKESMEDFDNRYITLEDSVKRRYSKKDNKQ
ncbi:MAG: hypothetical protein Q4Q53_05805 [Methanocorpusculum sp.]|nr:hypothetical protein [Methanocorpusculum sp.]